MRVDLDDDNVSSLEERMLYFPPGVDVWRQRMGKVETCTFSEAILRFKKDEQSFILHHKTEHKKKVVISTSVLEKEEGEVVCSGPTRSILKQAGLLSVDVSPGQLFGSAIPENVDILTKWADKSTVCFCILCDLAPVITVVPVLCVFFGMPVDVMMSVVLCPTCPLVHRPGADRDG